MKKLISFVSSLTLLTTLSPVIAYGEEYTVKKGDCWSIIAEAYNTTVESLLSLNNANINDYIIEGQTVYVEDNKTSTSVTTTNNIATNTNVYYPEKGEGWLSIACKTGVNINDLLSYNNTNIANPVIYGMPIKLTNNTITTNNVSNTNNYTSKLIGSNTLYNIPYGNSWYNITLMADKLNGVIVQPNEIFSLYNYPAFPNHCNELDGFKASGAFDENGDLVTAYGGGICFTSTVFYQTAVFECGMTSIERHNHVKAVSYAVPGKDAAVNLDGSYVADMKFKNTLGYPVQFKFSYDNNTGAMTVNAFKVY